MKEFMHKRFATFTHVRTTRSGLAFIGALAWACLSQASEVSCITAGRLDGAGKWAPKFDPIVLLDGAGRAISGASKADLTRVQAVDIQEPALLSACVGDQPLPTGEGSAPQAKSPVPAAKPGRLPVLGLGYPALRTGGVLVEVKVRVSADQVVMLTR